MSLNGLEDATVAEAYQASLAEGGGWFILKYSSRDAIEILKRGHGGVAEIRAVFAEHSEPLYGFLLYRRRKVIIKFVPEPTSRLLQARIAVHFPTITEKFSPHDTVFAISSPTELTDARLASACALHTATLSSSSSASSAKGHKLDGITEDAEEGQGVDDHDADQDGAPGVNQGPIRSLVDEALQAEPALNASLNASALDKPLPESRPTTATSQTTLEGARSEQMSSGGQDGTDGASLYSVQTFDAAYAADRRISSQNSRLSTSDAYGANYYKPKVKLGPRPSADPGRRPQTAGSGAGTGMRPVSSLPAGLRAAQRKPPPIPTTTARPKSRDASLLPQPPTPTLVPPPPPVPHSPSNLSRPTSSHSTATTISPSIHSRPARQTQEKQRLMKALELRKKQQQTVREKAKKAAEAKAEEEGIAQSKAEEEPAAAGHQQPEAGSENLATTDSTVTPMMIANDPVGGEQPKAPQNLTDQESNADLQTERVATQQPPVKILINDSSRNDTPKPHAATSNTIPMPSPEAPLQATPSLVKEEASTPAPEGDLSPLPSEQPTPSLPTEEPSPTLPIELPSPAPSAETLPLSKPISESLDDDKAQSSGRPMAMPMEDQSRSLTAPAGVISPESGPTTHYDDSSTPTEEDIILIQSNVATDPSTGEAMVKAPKKKTSYELDKDSKSRPVTILHVKTESHGDLPAGVMPTLGSSDKEQANGKPAAVTREANGSLGAGMPVATQTSTTSNADRSGSRERRRAKVTPIQVDASAESSEVDYLSDDSFMEELQSAQVQEAKPFTVPKSPGPSYYPRPGSSPSRPGSRPSLTPDASFGEAARSISATYYGDSVAVPKKVNVSSGISQRIKALTDLSKRESSPQSPTFSGSSSPDASASIVSLRKSSLRKSPSPTPPAKIGMSSKFIPVGPRRANDDGNRQRNYSASSRPSEAHLDADDGVDGMEPGSVTTRIVRPAQNQDSEDWLPNGNSSMHSSKDGLDSQRINRARTESNVSNGRDSVVHHPRTSMDSTRRGLNQRLSGAKSPTMASSNMSTSSLNSEDGMANEALRRGSEDGKKGSRTSRLFKRMSSSFSTSSKKASNMQQVGSPVKEAAMPELMKVPESPMVVQLGDLNIQFPDTLLWKRRWVEIDGSGNIVLQPGRAHENQKGLSKRFHLSEFLTPIAPDQERQEMPCSIILDFVDGRTLQCACGDTASQAFVLRQLQDCHRVWADIQR